MPNHFSKLFAFGRCVPEQRWALGDAAVRRCCSAGQTCAGTVDNNGSSGQSPKFQICVAELLISASDLQNAPFVSRLNGRSGECLPGSMLPSTSTLFSGASDECVISCVAVSLHDGKRLKQNTLHASEATFEMKILRGYRCREEA